MKVLVAVLILMSLIGVASNAATVNAQFRDTTHDMGRWGP